MTTCRGWLLVAAVACLMSVPARAQTGTGPRVAQVLRAPGSVEVRRGANGAWTPARAGSELRRGDGVRTYPASYAALTFDVGGNWQLEAGSELDLTPAITDGPGSITVRLQRGSAISRWRPDQRAGQAARLTVVTPSGQAGIAGTEWSLRVGPDGKTTLLVLDGHVDFGNDGGVVVVRANEAAEMEVGRPPVRLRLLSPEDRVQWVSAYQPSPARYALGGDPRANAELIQADALIGAGEIDAARTSLEAGKGRFRTDARFDALLARLLLFAGDGAASRAAADAAVAKDPQAVDGWLALGDWGIREGDLVAAQRGFTEAGLQAPQDARAWFGLGSVASDREQFRDATRFLGTALRLDPEGPGYRGQLGQTFTLANQFGAAAREYAAALEQQPEDYVSLTGRALMALKQGRENEAIELLQRVTLFEPRYARAHMYLGVAYYRQRRAGDAVLELQRASREDPRDPLPYMMLTQIHTDTYEPAKAIAAARAAQERMPYLKSFNQLSNTVKGGANLGNAMAFFGLEAWALSLAQQSYDPLWAGSHLFLGDRYADPYARTSEYFQGLLADSSVFGGSPRSQTLLPRPGAYLTLPVTARWNQFDGFDVQGRTAQSALAVNGLSNAWRPVAYALAAEGSRSTSGASGSATSRSLAGSIGVKPSATWSTFAVASHLDTNGAADVLAVGTTLTRVDGGVQYQIGPTSTMALKAGRGRTEMVAVLPLGGGTTSVGSTHQDLQLRHQFAWGRHHQVTWGVELARLPVSFEASGPLEVAVGTLLAKSEVGYVADRIRFGDRVILEAELVAIGTTERTTTVLRSSGLSDRSFVSDRTFLPRAGAVVRLAPGLLVRGAFQDVTTALGSQSTLGPVTTAGIPLDEALDVQLGRIRRLRGQVEWEWSPRTLTVGFLDRKRFGYVTSEQNPTVSQLTEALARLPLARLRNQLRDVSQTNVASPRLLEDTMAAPEGSTVAAAGVAVNHMLTAQVAVAGQYFWTRALDADGATPLPYYPENAFSLGTTWVSSKRIYASASAIYRSARRGVRRGIRGTPLNLGDREDQVLEPFNADWTGTIAASWEAPGKRWAVEMLAGDLFAKAPLHGPARRPSVTVSLKFRH